MKGNFNVMAPHSQEILFTPSLQRGFREGKILRQQEDMGIKGRSEREGEKREKWIESERERKRETKDR